MLCYYSYSVEQTGLVGRYNSTHWRIHVVYTENILNQCYGPSYVRKKEKEGIDVKSIPKPKKKKTQSNDEQRHLLTLSEDSPSRVLIRGSSNGNVENNLLDKFFDDSSSRKLQSTSKSRIDDNVSKKRDDAAKKIGIRRQEITSPYTVTQLKSLLARNRKILRATEALGIISVCYCAC